MAGRTGRTPDAGRVAALRRRIESWRRTRQGFAWMPEGLWAEAVALARSEGAYGIARDLELSYATLRKRLEKAAKPQTPRRTSAAAKGFVEVGGSELIGALGAGGSVVELTRSDGATRSRPSWRTARRTPAGALPTSPPTSPMNAATCSTCSATCIATTPGRVRRT